MPYCKLTRGAEADLESIAEYTFEEWGEAQAQLYREKINRCFGNIANRKVVSRTFSNKYPDVQVVRCEHHYIFFFDDAGENSIVFAILHERMDMIARLKNRLR